MCWEALRKSLNGRINKVNASNIKHITQHRPNLSDPVDGAMDAGTASKKITFVLTEIR